LINEIEIIHEAIFHSLGSLTELSLFQNAIKTIPRNVFSALSCLEILNLSGNQIGEIEDGAFNGLTSLVELKLNKNKIRSIYSKMFNQLGKLEVLILDDNEIEVIEEGCFNGLDSLKLLYFNNNPKIKSLSANTFVQLKNLERVELDERFREVRLLNMLGASIV
jgi:slit protein 1